MKNKNNKQLFWLIIALLIGSLLLAACSSTGGNEPAADDESMEEMDHDDEEMEDMDHDDHDDSEVSRIPNEGGAAITITSPADGDMVSALDQVIVEVDVAEFELGVDGSHWHVYVDGISFGMVMGGNTDQALPGLDPGEHEVSVYLALGSHEEYEDGSSVTIVVEE